jgi:hypothetical protein
MPISRINSPGPIATGPSQTNEASSSQAASAAVSRTRTDLTREKGPLADLPSRIRRTQSEPSSLLPRRGDTRALLEGVSARSEHPLTGDTPAHDDATAPGAVAAPGVLGSLISGGKKAGAFAWQHLDVRPMVSRADDAEFVAMLRAGGDVEQAAEPPAASLEALQRGVADMKSRVREAGQGEHALPADIAAHLDGRLDEIASVLGGLQKDEPLAKRAAIYLGMNLLLPVFPMAVSIGAKENKFVAELSAMYAKTALMAVGAMRSPTAADKHSRRDHFVSRHYMSLVQAAVFALPTFVKKLKHLNSNTPFAVGAGVATSAAAFHAFFGPQIKDYVNKNWRGSLNPGAAASWKQLSPETRQALADVMAGIKDSALEGEGALLKAKSEFLDGGKELSPYTSTQVHMAANAFHRVAKELADLLAAEGAHGENHGALAIRANHALPAKMAMMLLATGICAGTTALMIPDTIGVVDNAGDGIFTALLMTKAALDPNLGRHDALHEFRGFVGLSLIMLGVLAVDKGLSATLGKGKHDFDFIEKGGPLAAGVAAVAMSILNVTIPGPMGNVLSGGLEKLMSLKPSDLWHAMQAVGQNAMNFFADSSPDNELRTSSVQIEELGDDAHASRA